jgi:hypothetical protein
MKNIIYAVAMCGLLVGTARAEVQDRVLTANVAPEVLYQEIVATAKTMCNEAANRGEVFEVNRCVDVVVAKTVAEINRPSLSQYAARITPADVSKEPA